jgi:hypothetical protein
MVLRDRVKGYLTVEELHKALQHWIVLAQKDAFLEDILCLRVQGGRPAEEYTIFT